MKGFILAAAALVSTQMAFAANIPVITEKPYDEARKVLIEAGWQPAATVHANTPLSFSAEEFRALGFKEIHDCGSGIVPCLFYFRNAEGQKLKVVTLGESSPRQGHFPPVDLYELVSELPGSVGESKAIAEGLQPVASTTPNQPSAVDAKEADYALKCAAWLSIGANYSDNLPTDMKQNMLLMAEKFEAFSSASLGSAYVSEATPILKQNVYGELKAASYAEPSGISKWVMKNTNACIEHFDVATVFQVADSSPANTPGHFPGHTLPLVERFPTSTIVKYCSQNSKIDVTSAEYYNSGGSLVDALQSLKARGLDQDTQARIQAALILTYSNPPINLTQEQIAQKSYDECLSHNSADFVAYPLGT